MPEEQRGAVRAAAKTLGRLGGLRGGHRRAEALSAKRRSEIARMGANAKNRRYGNKHEKG